MSRAPRTTDERQSTDEYLASWHATMQLLRGGKSFSGHERNCAFLNCADGRFANISAVSGFDFDDDARAVAATDWDQDGDVDLWVTNRTGPRLRFLRNELPAAAENFIAFKLVGTKSNADAIGARVEVVVAGQLPSIATLYAGDAYISQSSKWLHFGLGNSRRIERVLVRWPQGDVEQFERFEPGQRYVLVEGSGTAQVVPRRAARVDLRPSEQISPSSSDAARIVLVSRPPMPILRFHPAADEDGTSNVEWGKSPVLITLWVSWCPTCLAELDMLSKQAATWRQLGVRVLTLCVDRLDADHGDNLTAARHVWEGLDPYLDCGFATAELVDKLRIVQRIVLNQQPAEVVPVSYLIDQRGELSVLYRGPVDMKTLRQDVDMLDVNSDRRRALAVPFHGLWTTPPGNLLLRPVAQLFREHGYQEDHDRIAQLELIRLARLRESVNANEANQLNRQFAIECFNLAHSLQSQEQIDASIEYYQQGLAVWDQSAEAHYHLARALKAKMAATSAAEH